MLKNQFSFDANAVTVTQVVANLVSRAHMSVKLGVHTDKVQKGAMTGGTVIGYCSQIFGRRFSIIFMCIIGGVLL